MDNSKRGRLDLDWWVVQKRQIYLLGMLAVAVLVVGGAGLYVWKYGLPFRGAKQAGEAPSGARFVSFEGDVRVIRAATRESLQATSRTQLYPGDTVQTQADGRARILMVSGAEVVVRPNSTVIIRDNAAAENGATGKMRVALDSGGLNVQTKDQPEGTSNVVETPQTQNQLSPQTGVSFGVDPNSKTEEIRVQTGSLETTTTRTGERATLRAGEYVAVNPTGALSRTERLLETPAPLAPRDLEKIPAGQGGAAGVALRWQRPQSGTPAHYRVEVATSPFFVPAGRVIERDQLAATAFNASDLRAGTYFWRVRATATSGQTSDWSEPRKFLVVTQGTGQSVEVADLKIEFVGGQIYLLRGRAQPGTTVRAAGREALAAADGSFQLQISVPAGGREATLEAFDPQGNSTQYKVPIAGNGSRGRG